MSRAQAPPLPVPLQCLSQYSRAHITRKAALPPQVSSPTELETSIGGEKIKPLRETHLLLGSQEWGFGVWKLPSDLTGLLDNGPPPPNRCRAQHPHQVGSCLEATGTGDLSTQSPAT